MESTEIMKFVESSGYKTKSEILAQFAGQDTEILNANLTFLVERNMVRKSKFQSPAGPEEIFYIPLK